MKVTNCTFLAKTNLYAWIVSFLILLVVEVSFLLSKDSRSDFLFQLWCVKSLQVITPVFTTRGTLNKLNISDFFLDLSELRSQGKLSPPDLEIKAYFENRSQACAHIRSTFVLVVELPSLVQLCAIPWIAACQVPLALTISQSWPKFLFIASVMPSSHLILWCPLLLICNAGDPSLMPGLGRSPGDGNDSPLQYSCLENSCSTAFSGLPWCLSWWKYHT